MNATEINKELNSVYKDDAPSYRTVAKWFAEFKDPERVFEDSPRIGRPSTITTDENIEAVEGIVMRDRQISIRCVAYELNIPTTTVYDIMSNHLGIKVSTRWVPKLLTFIQRANGVDCCQELLQESEVNSDNYFDRFVTGDGTWVYYTIPSVKKKPDEGIPTRLRRTRPAEKTIMVIFWGKYGILLSEYLSGGTTISGHYYASIIEGLRCDIPEKRHGKVSRGVLLFHDNAPVHKCKIVQAAIRKADFVELNDPAYSTGIVPSDYYLFSNLKKFFRGKNFSRDDEAIDTVVD